MTGPFGSVLLALEASGGDGGLGARLRAAGCVCEAVSPADALARLASAAPEVLVLDPSAVADPAAALAAALAAGTEVIAVTSLAELPLGLRCLRLGACDLLALPLQADALAVAVTRALERRGARLAALALPQLARLAALGRLQPGLAHDIANPVAVLASSVSSLEDALQPARHPPGDDAPGVAEPPAGWGGLAGAGALEALGEATEGIERLKLLVRDLRALARADPAAVDAIELAPVVDSALRVARAELSSRAQVVLELAPGLQARASHGALAQALVELLVGAARAVEAAGRRRGQVRVRSEVEGGFALVTVEDDGVSAPDALARAFAPLIPAAAPPRPDALGLAVANDLVRRQGGELTLRSLEGGGTAAEIRLPLAGRSGAARPDPPRG